MQAILDEIVRYLKVEKGLTNEQIGKDMCKSRQQIGRWFNGHATVKQIDLMVKHYKLKLTVSINE